MQLFHTQVSFYLGECSITCIRLFSYNTRCCVICAYFCCTELERKAQQGHRSVSINYLYFKISIIAVASRSLTLSDIWLVTRFFYFPLKVYDHKVEGELDIYFTLFWSLKFTKFVLVQKIGAKRVLQKRKKTCCYKGLSHPTSFGN